MDPARGEIATEEEYTRQERASVEKHEYVNGRIVAMAGGSPRHNLISGNVGATLGRLLARRGFVFSSNQRVFIPATGLYTYPDVTVVCGGVECHPKHGDTITNPKLVVEVLSRSTEAWDRGKKFFHYRAVPSLSGYLLVAQREQRIELYQRVDVGRWELTEAAEGPLALPALGIELPLAEVYAGAFDVRGESDDAPPSDS